MISGRRCGGPCGRRGPRRGWWSGPRIVLLAAQGVPGAQIAERAGCSEPTVIRWRSRFAARDLAGLVDEPRSGKPDTSVHSSPASPSRTATTSSSATLAAPRRSRTSSPTTAELLQRHLPTSRVVKAFNHIYSGDLTEQGQAPGTPGRRALAIADEATVEPAASRSQASPSRPQGCPVTERLR